MANKLEQENFNITNANKILDNGWRQGSIFDPRGILEEILLANGELLIICTQSCTVVSSRFEADPKLEAMVIKPLPKYNHRTFEATGKNQRKLHIEVIGNSQFKGVECDINRRIFFDRRTLLQIKPSQELEIGTEGIAKLAGWLGRSYTRIALPNLLVDRLKVVILPLILKCLDEKQPYGLQHGSPIHESVPYIYIDWQPRNDISDLFKLKFFFLCSDYQTAEALERELLEKLDPYQIAAGKQGIQVLNVICRTSDATFITDLNGYERLSEWDYLSGLGEVAHAPPKVNDNLSQKPVESPMTFWP